MVPLQATTCLVILAISGKSCIIIDKKNELSKIENAVFFVQGQSTTEPLTNTTEFLCETCAMLDRKIRKIVNHELASLTKLVVDQVCQGPLQKIVCLQARDQLMKTAQKVTNHQLKELRNVCTTHYFCKLESKVLQFYRTP